MMGEVAVSCEKIRYTIRDGEKALRPEKRSVPIFFQLGGKYAQVEYSPMGVIACIVPWVRFRCSLALSLLIPYRITRSITSFRTW